MGLKLQGCQLQAKAQTKTDKSIQEKSKAEDESGG